MDDASASQLVNLSHLLATGYGLAAILFALLMFTARVAMKEMKERIELSEKRAVVIEQNNKLIEELRDGIRDLSNNIDKLVMTFSSSPPINRRRGGS